MTEINKILYSDIFDIGFDETSDEIIKTDGDIFDLANAFLSIAPMTHKKLQKLCYYAKAWYLALNDVNLIKEHFEAWIHGAVQPRLYQAYRGYGFQIIPMFDGNVNEIPEEFLNFAKEIYDSYGHLSGDALERINHCEEPWLKARGDLMPWENCNRIINEEDMKEYFRKIYNEQ